MLGIFGGMGAGALLWLVTLPPPPNCSDPAKLTLDGERLYCAREAARSGELPQVIAGLNLIESWDEDHPLQGEMQKLREEWSKRLFSIARDRVDQSDMKGALDLIGHIPKSASIYPETQDAVIRWKKQWQAGEAIATKALAAMKQQNWDQAYEQISILNESIYDYWRLKRSGELAQQLGAEKQAWQALGQAKKVAIGGQPAQLNEAIVLAQQVPPDTYAEAESRAQIRQWGQKLLGMSVEKWKQGETIAAAVTLQLPEGVKPQMEIADLTQFGSAYQRVSKINSRWLPTLGHIWDLREAIAAIQQVKPDSPFYEQAQLHQKNWQIQLQDMIQLQYATATASLGQRDTLQLAIAQAKQIGSDRPRRKQAQTLISYWVDEIERMEDQPYLAQAEAKAKSGQIPDLKIAITEASRVAPDRVLRGRAQDLIATWQDQIETLEDQPILNQAIALADQSDLEGAIDRAGNIQAGRALYARAQGLIDDWRNQQIINAQRVIDRPILDRATALANRGDLTLAISVATQISPGRALYGEAQEDIARWRAERESWNTRTEDSVSSPTSPEPVEPSPTVDPLAPADPQPSQFDTAPLPKIDLVPGPDPQPGEFDRSNPGIDQSPPSEDSSSPEEDVQPSAPDESPSGPLRPRASYEGYYDPRYYQNSQ